MAYTARSTALYSRKKTRQLPHNSHALVQQHGIHKKVIYELLRPRTWKAPEDRRFFLNASVSWPLLFAVVCGCYMCAFVRVCVGGSVRQEGL
jgi:hypothetical protein